MWRLYTIFIKVAITQVVSVTAGAPNITGATEGTPAQTVETSILWGNGCFGNNYTAATKSCNSGGANQPTHRIHFDASLNSTIYGSSETITPLSQTCRLSIKY